MRRRRVTTAGSLSPHGLVGTQLLTEAARGPPTEHRRGEVARQHRRPEPPGDVPLRLITFDGGETLVASSEYRFRSLDDLTASLARNGFTVDHTYGDWQRGALTETSPEIVLVATRD